jgi:GT2 family glycosyltransferase
LNSSTPRSLRTSVVVLCYNGLDEVTRPCMESLLANTPADECELIAVDNASSDGTPAYLQSLAERYPNVRIQLNDANKGYAGGNNDGIRMARGEHIVLLNNDTLVPPGWLDRLLHPLETRPDIGLVGPITNSAGNEQRVDLPDLDESNFEQLAGQYTKRQIGHWFTTEKLGFFCVALRRGLVDEIGFLDDRFGIGMFEDDDYCIRATKQGYLLAVIEDCFVFHKGSVSFKKLNAAEYAQIFKKNRDYFFQKHGKIWVFSDIATAILKKINADLQPSSESDIVAALERARVRFTGMFGAMSHLTEMESRVIEVGGRNVADIQLAEKHRQLMDISDWASGLKEDNQKLASELDAKQTELMAMSDKAKDMKADTEQYVSELSAKHSELDAKHTELMAMSDWASSMKRELDAQASSRLFRLLKWVQRK